MIPHFLTSPHGERYLHEANRDAFLRHASADVFERWFDADLDAEDTLYVFVGTDSGLLPSWLARRASGAGSHRLFVELDEYHDLVHEALGGRLDDDATLCRASGWEAALAGIDPLRWLYGGKLQVVESAGCGAGYAPAYAPLLRRVRARLGELVHTTGANISTRPFIEAQIRNAADNRCPAAAAGRIGEGRTAIVLGGGPSLDDHLDWVIAHRDQLFVIAVSRIADRLADAGLVPDAVAAIDPHRLLFDISKRGLSLERTPLVSSCRVCSQLLQQWRGPTLYTGRALPWDNDAFDDADNLAAAGCTVGHAALWLAFDWGFSQILLSGFDLCYAPGGTTHASGSVESLQAALPSHYDSRVETYAGHRAGTAIALKLGRDELELMGERMAGAGTRVYNLAIGAARVDSIGHRRTDDVELDGPRPVLELERDPADTTGHLATLRRELEAARRGLRDVRRRCAEARRCLDGLHGAGGRVPDYRYKKKLDAVDRTMERRGTRWMKLVKSYGAFELARCVAPRGFDVMSDDELERWGRDYYRIVDDNARRLGRLVADAIERVEHRLLEVGPDTSADALVDYWLRDDTPGRVVTVFGDASITRTKDACEAIARARREHDAQLSTTETAQKRRHVAQQTDAGNVLRAIALLSDEGGVEDLTRFADVLDSMPDEWSPLALWAAGRCAELDGKPEAALDRYRQVVEHHVEMQESGAAPLPGAERLLEDVLIRIVNLQLSAGDGESALAGLEILARLSPAYVPRQATLLGLLGRREAAAETLQALIGTGHGDWRTAMQLADLYREDGAAAAADMAVELARRLRADAATTGATGDRNGIEAYERRAA